MKKYIKAAAAALVPVSFLCLSSTSNGHALFALLSTSQDGQWYQDCNSSRVIWAHSMGYDSHGGIWCDVSSNVSGMGSSQSTGCNTRAVTHQAFLLWDQDHSQEICHGDVTTGWDSSSGVNESNCGIARMQYKLNGGGSCTTGHVEADSIGSD